MLQTRGNDMSLTVSFMYKYYIILEPLKTQKSLKSSSSEFEFEQGSNEFEFKEILPLQLQPPTQFSHSNSKLQLKPLHISKSPNLQGTKVTFQLIEVRVREWNGKKSILPLGLAVAHIPRAKRVAEGDALAGVLGRATPCGPYGARPSASGNLTTSSQAHLPMGRDHPQGADTQLGTRSSNTNQTL